MDERMREFLTQLADEQPPQPAAAWRELVSRFDGDVDAAYHYLIATIRVLVDVDAAREG